MRDDHGNTEDESPRRESTGHERAGHEGAAQHAGAPPGGRLLDPEAGLATAEYAVATVAAVGFAGLLIAVLKSGMVKGLLEGIISSALSI